MKITSLMFVLWSLLCLSCANEDNLKEPVKHDSRPPTALTSSDISVRSISGGAVIKYSLPHEADIRAIEAQYTLTNGKQFTVRGSFLSDSIVVEGFIDTKPYDIRLYVVDNSENYSDPYVLSITPEKSPLSMIAESLSVIPDFGGLQITWENESLSTVSMFMYRVEGIDTLLVDQYYSKTSAGLWTIRGENNVESEYLMQIRDRWNNHTDMFSYRLTPLFEKELDYSTFSIPSDYFVNIGDPGSMPKWWDKEKSVPNWGDIYWPTLSFGLPSVATIKFAAPTMISRIVLWQYAWGATNYSHFYYAGNLRVVDLYGSTEASPSVSDPEDNASWSFIMRCEIKMPSGGWINQDSMTDEDFDVAKNRGHEFIFPVLEKAPKYTYLRFKIISSFDGAPEGGMLSEINLFGDDGTE